LATEIFLQGRFIVFLGRNEASFKGTIRLSGDTRRTNLGPFSFIVAGVEDNAYGHNAFNSNGLLVIFDRIALKNTIDILALGSAKGTVTPLSELDGQPIDGAEITINGNPVTETSLGSFQTAITTWSPMYELTPCVERLGIQSQTTALS